MKPIPGKPIEQQPQEVILRCLMWGEARGEGPVGMLAVAHVILNRKQRKPSRPLMEIMLQAWQFSCFNEQDPNRDRLLVAHIEEPQAWARGEAVATLIEGGWTRDPTNGATHYVVNSLWRQDKPGAWHGL